MILSLFGLGACGSFDTYFFGSGLESDIARYEEETRRAKEEWPRPGIDEVIQVKLQSRFAMSAGRSVRGNNITSGDKRDNSSGFRCEFKSDSSFLLSYIGREEVDYNLLTYTPLFNLVAICDIKPGKFLSLIPTGDLQFTVKSGTMVESDGDLFVLLDDVRVQYDENLIEVDNYGCVPDDKEQQKRVVTLESVLAQKMTNVGFIPGTVIVTLKEGTKMTLDMAGRNIAKETEVEFIYRGGCHFFVRYLYEVGEQISDEGLVLETVPTRRNKKQ